MKTLSRLTSLIFLLALTPAPICTGSQTSPRPFIRGVRLEGKKVIVKGDNFQRGAVVVVGDREEKTKRDHDSPDDTLVAKKAGKHLTRGRAVSVLVENPDGKDSNFFYIYADDKISAQVIFPTFIGEFTSLYLKAGDHLLLDFGSSNTGGQIIINVDPNYFTEVKSESLEPTQHRLYRADRAGSTFIRVEVRFSEPGPLIRNLSVVVE